MALDLLEIDGLSMRTEAWNVTTRTGRYSMPLARGEDMIMAGKSGYTFVPNKPYGAGIGVFDVWVSGANSNGTVPTTHAGRRTQFETNLRQIQRVFTRRHKLSTVRSAQADGTIRRALVQWDLWSEPEVQAQGTRAQWQVGFSIPSVWWEDEATTAQSATVGATLPKTLSLTSFANMTGVIEDGVIAVSGAITNPRVTESETGAYVELIQVVADATTWTVDVGAATSKIGAGSVMTNTRHVGGYPLLTVSNVLGAGTTPSLVLSGSSGGANCNLTFTARRKWAHG